MSDQTHEAQMFQDAGIPQDRESRLAARLLHRLGLGHTDTRITPTQRRKATRAARKTLSQADVDSLTAKHAQEHALGDDPGPRQHAAREPRNPWRKNRR